MSLKKPFFKRTLEFQNLLFRLLEMHPQAPPKLWKETIRARAVFVPETRSECSFCSIIISGAERFSSWWSDLCEPPLPEDDDRAIGKRVRCRPRISKFKKKRKLSPAPIASQGAHDVGDNETVALPET